jgi:hypothetical protein
LAEGGVAQVVETITAKIHTYKLLVELNLYMQGAVVVALQGLVVLSLWGTAVARVARAVIGNIQALVSQKKKLFLLAEAAARVVIVARAVREEMYLQMVLRVPEAVLVAQEPGVLVPTHLGQLHTI